MIAVSLFVLYASMLMNTVLQSNTPSVDITVQTAQPIYTMAGGIGASWHALSEDRPLENEKYDFPVRLVNPRGSGYGGNPPVSAADQWEQLYRHASWLGLDWIRVEVCLRMWEPQKGVFQWDNEEMQALYRILDWCEKNSADVFLQNMWSDVEWNAYPGVHPIASAPRDLDAFAEGMAGLVTHLTKSRHYTCIKWFCITNEPPGGTWGYWWATGSHPSVGLTPALKAVRQAFDRKSLSIPISAPDWTDLPPFDASKLDFDPFVGAYDIHSYQGVDKARQEMLARWANHAHGHGKPFFLSEMGNMKLGWGESNPGPKTFAASLSNAESIVRGLGAGVDGFNRWSYTNRGDLDGQWQLVQTWDREKKRYLDRVAPESAAYYGYGIISRLIAKHSQVLRVTAKAGPGTDPDRTLAVALQAPDGNLTLILLNLGKKPSAVRIHVVGTPRSLSKYQVTGSRVEDPGFRLRPESDHGFGDGVAAVEESLPAESITVFSSFRLEPEAPGITSRK